MDVGALVQEQPHHLDVPAEGGVDETVEAILCVYTRPEVSDAKDAVNGSSFPTQTGKAAHAHMPNTPCPPHQYGHALFEICMYLTYDAACVMRRRKTARQWMPHAAESL